MSVITHTWELFQKNTVQREVKHCKMCGKNSRFTDTNIRRHNSNGKHIYRFAIYKCEQNHTWNKKLAIYKTHHDHAKVYGKQITQQENSLTEIPVTSYTATGISAVYITLKHVSGTYRIDSLLSNQIPDWSRITITNKIRNGSILINDQTIKPSTKVAKNNIICINLIEDSL
ncbi:hypothetical protein [Sutcliffiella halmapala]|uniref:hypothetical protein n=1 Tax=Sutcliffiella halmapala TaxID=79882 RepID=UPI000994D13F|nr:hypothetical protein [Sutcliffiella halmapala]